MADGGDSRAAVSCTTQAIECWKVGTPLATQDGLPCYKGVIRPPVGHGSIDGIRIVETVILSSRQRETRPATRMASSGQGKNPHGHRRSAAGAVTVDL